MPINNTHKQNLRNTVATKLTLGITIAILIVCFFVFDYVRKDICNKELSEIQELAKLMAIKNRDEIKANLKEATETVNLFKKIVLDANKNTDTADSTLNAIAFSILQKNSKGNLLYINNLEIEGEIKKNNSILLRNAQKIREEYLEQTNDTQEIILEPYFSEKEGNKIWTFSISNIILRNKETIDIVTYEPNLTTYNVNIDTTILTCETQYSLITDKNTILLHTNTELQGKKNDEIISTQEYLSGLKEAFTSDSLIEIEYYSHELQKKIYTVFVPLKIWQGQSNWTFALSVPISDLLNVHSSFKHHYSWLIFIVVSFVLLASTFYAKNLIKPLKKVAKTLSLLVNNNIFEIKTIKPSADKENNRLIEAANTLTEDIKQIVIYLGDKTNTTKNNEYKKDSIKYIITSHITKIKDILFQYEKSEQTEIKANKNQQQWHIDGVNMFSLLFQNYSNIKMLTQSVITAMLEYIEVQSGAIYLLEEINGEEVLNLCASCGLPLARLENKIISKNQGIIWTCMLEKETIYVDEVQSGFTSIGSGLGKAKPSSILVVPLISNNNLAGILELESLGTIEKYKITFVEAVCTAIASTILNLQVTEKTETLLLEAKYQAEELSIQEEELRKNIIDMGVTQELASQNEIKQQKIIDAVTDTCLYAEYDIYGTFIKVNELFLQFHNLTTEQIIGKKAWSIEIKEIEKKDSIAEIWDDMLDGNTIERTLYLPFKKGDYWLKETYMPILDQYENPIKIINISVDVTEEKRKEQKIAELQEKLQNIKTLKLGQGKDKNEACLIPIETILSNQDFKFKNINLKQLKKVYKNDATQIKEVLRAYKETITKQIKQIKQLIEDAKLDALTSRIIGLRTKATYLGLNNMLENLKQLEFAAVEGDPANRAIEIIDEISERWVEAMKEINSIDLT